LIIFFRNRRLWR